MEKKFKILLTGANGYIGSRLLSSLVEDGHHVVALVRSASRFSLSEEEKKHVTIVVGDLLNPKTLEAIPKEIDAAYYLVHSMGETRAGFKEKEESAAKNFLFAIETTSCKQIIYLGALASKAASSEHMQSRRSVESILLKGKIPTTVLRAGVIIGSGSASFEIIRDLVEKLPVMTTPKWVSSKCQPIAIRDVLFYLKAVLDQPQCIGKVFEIGGPKPLSYRDMLLTYAKIRGLKRWIIPVPVLTPTLSSYWLFFITSTSFSLAAALIDSLKTDAIVTDHSIDQIIEHKPLSYEEALQRAFKKIEQKEIVSSWKDALVQSRLGPELSEHIKVPKHGCLTSTIILPYKSRSSSIEKLWSIGGRNGWYYLDFIWRIRGFIDRCFGGFGLQRGRTHPSRLRNGDVLDFWRILLADKEKGHLLLYAEMKVPGEAWLEFIIEEEQGKGTVTQIATFRPKGLLGRLYWYLLLPFHFLIFRGLCKEIAKGVST